MAGIRASIQAELDTSKVDMQFNKMMSRLSGKQINFNVNSRSFTQPLGRITASSNEFTKSLEASNARVIAFGASVGIINAVSNAFKSLVAETVKFEKTLADINVIMNASNESIQRFGHSLFDVAKNTAQSFDKVANAALEFSRQGLSMEETLRRTNDALILTRLTSLKAEEAVAGLTAAVNAFGGAGLTTTAIIDKLAAVDVKFAVSSEDLINALERTGAVAIDAGVELDNLIGLVTALQQTTARGGSVIGNGLKTIFTRIQRPDSIRQLEDMNIAVRDLTGSILPADTILSNIAKNFDRLSQAQQSNVVQFAAGIFQANVFRASLRDLAKEQGIYTQASKISASAAGEAALKNEQLNKTVSALASQSGTALAELAEVIGKLTLNPELGGMLESFLSVVTGFKDALGGGEEEGNTFAKGLVRGIGNVLTGPALFAFGAVFIKMLANVSKFASQSLKDVLGITTRKEKIKQMEQSIVDTLSENKHIQEGLNELEGDRLAQEKFLLKIIEAQTNAMAKQKALAASLAGPLLKSGVNPNLTSARDGPIDLDGDGKVDTFSRGAIPSRREKAAEISGAISGGYMPGSVRKMNMPGLGKVVYNTAEKVKKFPGMDQPAIMPPRNSKAGKKYQDAFAGQHGFDPYAHHGFVPNFATKVGNKLQLEKSKFKLFGNSMDIGRAVGVNYKEIEKHFQDKTPITANATLQEIILSSDAKKTKITGKETLFDVFNALSGAGVDNIERDFDIRPIAKGARGQGNLSNEEFAERKSVNLLNQEQKLNKEVPSHRLTYDPKTKTGVQNYPVDIIAFGERFPSHEVKSGKLSAANLISKSLRMASDKSLITWMADNKISGGKSLKAKNLANAKNLAGKMGIAGSGKDGEFMQEDADQWGMSRGLVPNFANLTLYRGQKRDTIDKPTIGKNMPSFAGVKTPDDVVKIIQNFVKSHVSGPMSGYRDLGEVDNKMPSGATSFSTSETVAKNFAGSIAIGQPVTEGQVLSKTIPEKNVFNKKKLLRILSKGADATKGHYPKVEEFKEAMASGAIQEWAEQNGGIYLNVAGRRNDRSLLKHYKTEYGRKNYDFYDRPMNQIVPQSDIGRNPNGTFQISPREAEVMQVFNQGLVPNFGDLIKFERNKILAATPMHMEYFKSFQEGETEWRGGKSMREFLISLYDDYKDQFQGMEEWKNAIDGLHRGDIDVGMMTGSMSKHRKNMQKMSGGYVPNFIKTKDNKYKPYTKNQGTRVSQFENIKNDLPGMESRQDFSKAFGFGDTKKDLVQTRALFKKPSRALIPGLIKKHLHGGKGKPILTTEDQAIKKAEEEIRYVLDAYDSFSTSSPLKNVKEGRGYENLIGWLIGNNPAYNARIDWEEPTINTSNAESMGLKSSDFLGGGVWRIAKKNIEKKFVDAQVSDGHPGKLLYEKAMQAGVPGIFSGEGLVSRLLGAGKKTGPAAKTSKKRDFDATKSLTEVVQGGLMKSGTQSFSLRSHLKNGTFSFTQDTFKPSGKVLDAAREAGVDLQALSGGFVPNFRYWKKHVQFAKGMDGGWGIKGDTSHLHGFIDYLENKGGNSQREIDKLKTQLKQVGDKRYKEIQDLGYPSMGREGAKYYSKRRAISDRPEMLNLKGVFLKNLKDSIHAYNDENNSKFYQGFVPNFANPLDKAISREMNAGIPSGMIRIDQSDKLKGPLNPDGLAVINTRDEPGGVQQGIARARKLGLDPKKHGASHGLIPNFENPTFRQPRVRLKSTKEGLDPGVVKQIEESLKRYNASLDELTGSTEEAKNASDDKSRGDFEGLQKLFYFQSAISMANGFLEQFSESSNFAVKKLAEFGMGLSNTAAAFVQAKTMVPELMEALSVNKDETGSLAELFGGAVSEKTSDARKETEDRVKEELDRKAASKGGKLGPVDKLVSRLGKAGRIFGRFLPVLGNLYAGFTALNEAIKFVTGEGIFDHMASSADQAAKRLEELAKASDTLQASIDANNAVQSNQTKIAELETLGKERTVAQDRELYKLQTESYGLRRKQAKAARELYDESIVGASGLRAVEETLGEFRAATTITTEELMRAQRRIAQDSLNEQRVLDIDKSVQSGTASFSEKKGSVGQVGFDTGLSLRNFFADRQDMTDTQKDEAQNKLNKEVAEVMKQVSVLGTKGNSPLGSTQGMGSDPAAIINSSGLDQRVKDMLLKTEGAVDGMGWIAEIGLNPEELKIFQNYMRKLNEGLNKSDAEKNFEAIAQSTGKAKRELDRLVARVKHQADMKEIENNLTRDMLQVDRNRKGSQDKFLREQKSISEIASIQRDNARKALDQDAAFEKAKEAVNKKSLDALRDQAGKNLQVSNITLTNDAGTFQEKAKEFIGKTQNLGDGDTLKAAMDKFNEGASEGARISKEEMEAGAKLIKEKFQNINVDELEGKELQAHLNTIFAELAEKNDSRVVVAAQLALSEADALKVSEDTKKEMRKILREEEKGLKQAENSNLIAQAKLKLENEEKILNSRTVEGAKAKLKILSQSPVTQGLINLELMGEAANLKVINDHHAKRIEFLRGSAAFEEQIFEQLRDRARKDAESGMGSLASAQKEVSLRGADPSTLSKKGLEVQKNLIDAAESKIRQEITGAGLAAEDAELRNQILSSHTASKKIASANLKTETFNLQTDIGLKKAKLDLLKDEVTRSELVSAMVSNEMLDSQISLDILSERIKFLGQGKNRSKLAQIQNKTEIKELQLNTSLTEEKLKQLQSSGELSKLAEGQIDSELATLRYDNAIAEEKLKQLINNGKISELASERLRSEITQKGTDLAYTKAKLKLLQDEEKRAEFVSLTVQNEMVDQELSLELLVARREFLDKAKNRAKLADIQNKTELETLNQDNDLQAEKLRQLIQNKEIAKIAEGQVTQATLSLERDALIAAAKQKVLDSTLGLEERQRKAQELLDISNKMQEARNAKNAANIDQGLLESVVGADIDIERANKFRGTREAATRASITGRPQDALAFAQAMRDFKDSTDEGASALDEFRVYMAEVAVEANKSGQAMIAGFEAARQGMKQALKDMSTGQMSAGEAFEGVLLKSLGAAFDKITEQNVDKFMGDIMFGLTGVNPQEDAKKATQNNTEALKKLTEKLDDRVRDLEGHMGQRVSDIESGITGGAQPSKSDTPTNVAQKIEQTNAQKPQEQVSLISKSIDKQTDGISKLSGTMGQGIQQMGTSISDAIKQMGSMNPGGAAASIISGVGGGALDLLGGLGSAIFGGIGKIGGALFGGGSKKFNGGKIQRFNTGGLVQGPGGIDNVPAMLSAGEYVMSKQEVARSTNLNNISKARENNAKLSGIQAFNKGGQVDDRLKTSHSMFQDFKPIGGGSGSLASSGGSGGGSRGGSLLSGLLGLGVQGAVANYVGKKYGPGKRQDPNDKPPEFDKTRLEVLNGGMGSTVSMGMGDPRLSGRFVAENEHIQGYGSHLLELHEYNVQKQNAATNAKLEKYKGFISQALGMVGSGLLANIGNIGGAIGGLVGKAGSMLGGGLSKIGGGLGKLGGVGKFLGSGISGVGGAIGSLGSGIGGGIGALSKFNLSGAVSSLGSGAIGATSSLSGGAAGSLSTIPGIGGGLGSMASSLGQVATGGMAGISGATSSITDTLTGRRSFTGGMKGVGSSITGGAKAALSTTDKWRDKLNYKFTGGQIPAMLTRGESVIPAPIAQRMGYSNLSKINQTGQLPIVDGPGGIDNVGPVGMNAGDFVIKRSSTDKLLKRNPFMMKMALQNPEVFRKGGMVKGYYNGGVVGGDMATSASPQNYSNMSGGTTAMQPSNPQVEKTSNRETGATTNNINISVKIDQSGQEKVSTDAQGNDYQKEQELSMKIKTAVLQVIREEKRIGGELS